MGAWIEIRYPQTLRGHQCLVAPFMGAWIEMDSEEFKLLKIQCRTLYGCVD